MLKEIPIRELLEAVGPENFLLTLLMVDKSKVNSRNVVNYRLKYCTASETTFIKCKNTVNVADAEASEATQV